MSLMIAEKPNRVESERALATLWERAASLRDGLTTQDGSRYWVSYPGRPNARAGPDYLDARLLNESGELVTGDVELHLNAPDWYGHGHHSDPNYNGVVLHIVLSSKGHTTTMQHSKMQVPIASIQGYLDELEAAELASNSAADFAGIGDLKAVLDRAGDERFLSRSDGFLLEMDKCSADQAVYRSMMEALGYASNRKPFRLLADRVTFEVLAGLAEEPDSTRARAIHAVLLRASGLASISDAGLDRKEVTRMARHLPKSKPVPKDMWHLFRVRPANHPLHRMQGAVQILQNCLESGITRRLQDALVAGGVDGLEETFLCKPYVGTARARDIAVNVAMPFLHALALQSGDKSLQSLSLKTYRESPSLSENEITREMRRRLEVPPKLRLSARRQQGLMHLYRSGRRSKA